MYKPKSSSHCCLLSVRCVKLTKSRIKSQSPRLFHKLNLFCCSFQSMSDYYDHIIQCHLSLPCIPRARFARIAQFRCANIVPTARPSAVGNVRRLRETCSSTRIKREKKDMVEPLRSEERHRKPEAGRCLGAHLAMMVMDSPSIADGANGSERTRGNQSVDSLTTDTSSRTHRTSERSSRRAPATVCPIQTPTRRVSLPEHGWWRETRPRSNRSKQPRRRERHTARQREGRKGTRWDNPSSRCLQPSSMAPSDGKSWSVRAGRERGGVTQPISQAAYLSI